MNKNLNTIYHYHEETKHTAMRHARSLGYLDWATQPNPYRSYEGAEKVGLRLSTSNTTPLYSDVFKEVPKAPLCFEAISQLFQFSLGLAATKSHQGSSWSLRCNASSGNLHPTEAYIVLPPLKGVDEKHTVSHYNPQHHHLEKLASFESKVLAEDEFLLSLSSIYWREAWKYGERSFRYVNLDAGHALRSLEVSAKLLGWSFKRLDISVQEHNRLLGLNQEERFHKDEREEADILLLFSKNDAIDIKALLEEVDFQFQSIANILSPSHYPWEIINEVADATQERLKSLPRVDSQELERQSLYVAKDVILKRRSAQMMNADNAEISKEQFYAMLDSVQHDIMGHENFVSFAIFVHKVEGLDSGLYLFSRNSRHLNELKGLMKESFRFEKMQENQELYLLQKGDFSVIAKNLSCNQDIAKDGAFSLAMLCEFSSVINSYGAYMYKELYYECGSIGQQLYLEATSVDLQATGIGCFLDDVMHSVLGLKGKEYQSLYHFTVGRAIVDTRLTTTDPYAHLKE